jgi:putative tryptophan/tyrosine transport system substrate-binding protein
VRKKWTPAAHLIRVNASDLYRRAATYVNKIFERCETRRVACRATDEVRVRREPQNREEIGLTIPASVLARGGGQSDQMKTVGRQQASGRQRKHTIISIALCMLFIALCSLTEAQQPGIPSIGRLSSGPSGDPLQKAGFAAFQRGLRELGWLESQNVNIEPRWTGDNPERARDVAADLVRRRVDVIVANGSPMIAVAKEATSAIPIVMAGAGTDPVAAGFVASLAKPGGNITGISLLSADLDAKRLELLKEVVPGLRRVAILQNPEFPQADMRWRDAESAAKLFELQAHPWRVRSVRDIEAVFSSAATLRLNGVLVLSDPVILERHRSLIINLAEKHRLPVIYPWRQYVEDGGLMTYSANLLEMHRSSARYVDKILKGAKTAEIPVEQPTKFDLVINLKTAKQIGVTIPPSVLARADRVIK